MTLELTGHKVLCGEKNYNYLYGTFLCCVNINTVIVIVIVIYFKFKKIQIQVRNIKFHKPLDIECVTKKCSNHSLEPVNINIIKEIYKIQTLHTGKK